MNLVIADLDGLLLGQMAGGTLYIDSDAAGNGWFVDSTPDANEEFTATDGSWVAGEDSDAFGKIDLLTAINHELGHYFGLDHSSDSNDLI